MVQEEEELRHANYSFSGEENESPVGKFIHDYNGTRTRATDFDETKLRNLKVEWPIDNDIDSFDGGLTLFYHWFLDEDTGKLYCRGICDYWGEVRLETCLDEPFLGVYSNDEEITPDIKRVKS